MCNVGAALNMIPYAVLHTSEERITQNNLFIFSNSTTWRKLETSSFIYSSVILLTSYSPPSLPTDSQQLRFCQKTRSSTHLGNIAATSLSVFCLSTSSSSVLSLIRSSRLDEYCSNMRSIESIMFVFFPLVMLLNCNVTETQQSCHTPELPALLC